MIDETTVAFADFRGNKQYVTAGNLVTDDRIAIIMVDYPKRMRLKVLGHGRTLEGAQAAGDWLERVRMPSYKAVVERVFVIQIAAFDWNCPQHIVPRYTAEEIQQALEPTQRRIEELERENASLRNLNSGRS